MQFCLKSGEDYPPGFKTGGSIPLVPAPTPLIYFYVLWRQGACSDTACTYEIGRIFPELFAFFRAVDGLNAVAIWLTGIK